MRDDGGPSSNSSSPPRQLIVDKMVHRLAVIFAVLNAIIYLGWVAMYVSASFFPAAAGWAGPDAVGYVTGLAPYRHAFLYVAAILGWAVSVLTVLRHQLLPPVCMIAILAATADWVETTLAPRSGEGLTDLFGYLHLIIYAIACSLNLVMWRRNMLRAPAFPFLTRRD